MISIEAATATDTEDFLASAIALVATDAGRYDAEATDVDWADRSGAAYAAGALSGDNVVLLARDGDTVAGHLVGRLYGPRASIRCAAPSWKASTSIRDSVGPGSGHA